MTALGPAPETPPARERPVSLQTPVKRQRRNNEDATGEPSSWDDLYLYLGHNPNISQQAKDALKAALPNCWLDY